jgi:hypothetical protein
MGLNPDAMGVAADRRIGVTSSALVLARCRIAAIA